MMPEPIEERSLCDPAAYHLIEFVGVFGPLRAGSEPRFVDHFRVADEPHHALGDVLRRSRDRHPPPVPRAIDVARGVVDRAVAPSFLHHTKLATREVVFYTDQQTGKIFWEYDNPFTGKRDEVFHIANDPVNFRVRLRDGKRIGVSLDGKREFGETTPAQEWDDYYVWHSDVFPFYTLPGWEQNYTAAELFDFYVPKADLQHTGPPNVMVSWTRVGPWLPWMRMDQHKGLLVYHARSRRLESWDLLPEQIKATVKEKFPIYLTAPDKVDPNKPNVTSWSYYAEEMKKRQKP